MLWRAEWVEQNKPYSLIFYSSRNKGVASIDFTLLMLKLGKKIPERFTLEERKDARFKRFV